MADKSKDEVVLEEDDEFEEFEDENWREDEEDQEDVKQWEDDWDDEELNDDFAKQLRAELEKSNKPQPMQT